MRKEKIKFKTIVKRLQSEQVLRASHLLRITVDGIVTSSFTTPEFLRLFSSSVQVWCPSPAALGGLGGALWEKRWDLGQAEGRGKGYGCLHWLPNSRKANKNQKVEEAMAPEPQVAQSAALHLGSEELVPVGVP